MKKKILLITGFIHPNSAQGIRYRNLFEVSDYKSIIHHLSFDSKLFNLKVDLNTSLCYSINTTGTIFYYFTRWLLKKLQCLFFFPDEFLFYINKYKNSLINLCRQNKYDSIIIGMTPFSFLKLGPVIKTLLPDVFLVADFSDPFSGNAKYLLNKRYKSRAMFLEKKYIPFFDAIIVLNDKIREYYVNMDLRSSFYTIEQGINDVYFDAVNEIQIKNKLILIYAGNFYKGFRDPEVLFNAIAGSGIDIEFRVFGEPHFSEFNKLKYEFIKDFPTLCQKDLVKEIEKSHVIVLIDNFYGMQVPGKTLECLAFDRPVLFIYENTDSPSHEYVTNSQGVFACKNVEYEIISCLRHIYNNYITINKKFEYSLYTWPKLRQKYLKIIGQGLN